MKKTEILEKSRKENKEFDERQQQEVKQAGYIGGLAGMITAVCFALVSFFRGQSVYPFLAIVFMTLGVISLFNYLKVNKTTSYIVGAIAWLIAGIIFSIMFLLGW